jgi:hypothetical protein
LQGREETHFRSGALSANEPRKSQLPRMSFATTGNIVMIYQQPSDTINTKKVSITVDPSHPSYIAYSTTIVLRFLYLIGILEGPATLDSSLEKKKESKREF